MDLVTVSCVGVALTPPVLWLQNELTELRTRNRALDALKFENEKTLSQVRS